MKKAVLFLVNMLWLSFVVAQPLPKIELKPVFPDLKGERPVWMSEAPDGSGRFFVVYQDGKILVVRKGSDGGEAKEFLNIEDRHPYFENEDGLLSIAFHPGFKTNGLFYIYYTQQNTPEQMKQFQDGRPTSFPYRSVVSEFKVSAADPDKADLSSERILLTVPEPFWNHKGGELAFGPDGYLYLGLGDGGAADDPFGNGQNTATLLAKMLRIDVNTRSTVRVGWREQELPYGIPSDNPFANEPNMAYNARKEIYAYGLRNPWRYSWDSPKPARCGWATSARICGRKWTWSPRAAITAGAFAKARTTSNPARPGRNSLTRSWNIRIVRIFNRKECFPTTASGCA